MPPKRKRGGKAASVPARRTRRSEPTNEESVHKEPSKEEGGESDPLDPKIREAIAENVLHLFQEIIPTIIQETTEGVVANLEKLARDKKSKRKKDQESEEEEDTEEEEDESESDKPKGCDYKFFKICGPPSFSGTGTARDAQQWLREIEAIIRISGCKENQKVLYASHSLVSEARCWWDNVTTALGEKKVKKMNWLKFKKKFIEQFCTEVELEKIEKEFLIFEAGNMTHQEYTTRFNELARLCPDLVTPEPKRIKRYIQGLPPGVGKFVKVCKPATYDSAVALSATLYEDPVIKKGSDEKEKGMVRQDGFKGKKDRDREGKRNEKGKTEKELSLVEVKKCTKCGKMHSGTCRFKDSKCFHCQDKNHVTWNCPKIKCFTCGEPGHKSNDCPKAASKDGEIIKEGERTESYMKGGKVHFHRLGNA